MIPMEPPVQTTIEINIGSGHHAKVSKTIGASVFIGNSSTQIPIVFDLFIYRSHALPELIIFVNIIKNYEYSKLRKHYKINIVGKNILQADIYLGFKEANISLLDIIDNALNELKMDFPQFITVYHVAHEVRIKPGTPFYFQVPLYFYKLIKDIFPEPCPILVPLDCFSILTNTLDLDGTF